MRYMVMKNLITVRFSPMETAMKNPYIGFTSYQRFRGDPLFADIVVRPEGNLTETERTECYPVSAEASLMREGEAGFYPDTEVAYIRILWKDFEPERKRYNYALIADILRKAREKGQTVMLRLMPHSTRASDDVPEWLKGMIPCPERPAGMRVKDSPEDPMWLTLFGEAIEAIGAAFDSDPTLDVVDISITGAWGEGHRVAEYPRESLERLADVYARAFPNTRLIGQVAAPWLCHYLDAKHPCGWRGDGTGETKHMNVFYPAAAAAMPDLWRKAPVSFESYWWLGEWERQGWDIDEIIEKTLSWHISTFNGKSFPIPDAWREKITYWLSKMGYHFVLTEASYPEAANAGDYLPVTLKVTNRGVAPIYSPIPLRIRLRGEEERVFTTNVDVREWLPGEHEVRVKIALPREMKAGEYDAAITLSGEDTPVVHFETQGARDGAYLTIGRIKIEAVRDDAREEKAYLQTFMRDLGFSDEARRALEEAYDVVFAREKAVRLYEEIRRTFEEDPDRKFKYLIEASDRIAETCSVSRYTVYLLVLILLSESSKKVYAARGLSEKLWRDNMLDLRYTAELCILLKGVHGTYCPDWYAGFFAGKRLTFGRLQFEPGCLGKEYRKGDVTVSPDETVLYIHIPRTGERLSPEDVDAACAAASDFFKERKNLAKVVFACQSWLLYPENKKILPNGSNLLSFISRFEVIDVAEDPEYKELWRLFDVEYKGDVDALPQDTSLRRAYAERVRAHKPLGVALGVWIYKA